MESPEAKRSRASFLGGIFALLGFLRLFLVASGVCLSVKSHSRLFFNKMTAISI